MKMKRYYFMGFCCLFLASCQEEILEEVVMSPGSVGSTEVVWQFEQEALRKGIASGDVDSSASLESVLPVFTPASETRGFSKENTSNWMSRIDGNRLLTELNMPGTHNSAADKNGSLNCQVNSITQQLEWGVRVLDIRCRHVNNAFFIHHDRFYQDKSFGSVMEEINAFLNKNPSETIIMLLKEEYDAAETSRSFNDTFLWYMNINRWKDKIWKGANGLPKSLDAARGKIIPVCRFSSSEHLGIGWSDNSTFTTSVGRTEVRVQDSYYVSTAYWMNWKWTQINNLFEEARSSGLKDVLYINFLSGSSSGLLPWDCAHGCNGFWGMNEQFYRHCDGQNLNRRLGCVMQDFCRDDYHTNNIIKANNYKPISDKPTIWGVGSQETMSEDGRAVNAIDGNPNTWWHTQYTGNYSWNGSANIGIRYPTARNYEGITITQRPNAISGRPGAFKVEVKDFYGEWITLRIQNRGGIPNAIEWMSLNELKEGEQIFYFANNYPGTDYRVTFTCIRDNKRHTFVSEIKFF